MGRPKSTAGGRPHVVCARLSADEVAALDQMRGYLDRGAYLRWLLLQARKGQTKPLPGG